MKDLVENYVLEAAEKPLTPREERDMARANVYLMDVEMDGRRLPAAIEKLNNLRRKLRPSEQRQILDYFYNNAPGNY